MIEITERLRISATLLILACRALRGSRLALEYLNKFHAMCFNADFFANVEAMAP